MVPWWSGRCITIHKESVYNRGTIDWSEPCPISHAWLDTEDHVDVQTPINRYEWPVTIPKDADLNLICIEMLNLGVEYTWLDVLCLRQVGGPGEDMHIEEWKLDVPTIGGVYTSVNVVWYLSGMGQPLSLKKGDLDSDWSWFQHAWTLQEIGHAKGRKIAGDMLDGPLHAKPIDEDGNYETELLTRFHKQLQSIDSISSVIWSETRQYSISRLFGILESMQNWVSTNPVDRVAGVFCLQSKRIPSYNESLSLEEAWAALVNSMDEYWWMIISLYPKPDNAGEKWIPSWNQVMTKPLPAYK